MNRSDFAKWLVGLLEEHGLVKQGWTVHFNERPNTRLGMCDHARKQLQFTGWYVDMNDEAHVKGTGLHELAHALAGHGAKHGPKWKAWARKLGIVNPKARCNGDNIKSPPLPFRAVCVACGRVHEKTRRPRRKLWCKCIKRMGRELVDDNQLAWQYDPAPAAHAERRKRSRRRRPEPPIKMGGAMGGDLHGDPVPELSGAIDALLKQLAQSNDSRDKKRIRAKLRRLGHRGGLVSR